MTSASSQPSSLTSLISWAKALTVLPSIPKFMRSGENFAGDFENDPFIFRRAVVHEGFTAHAYSFALPFAQMIARETPDLNIFTEPGDGFVNDVGDLFVRILDKSLFQQTDFGVESLHFTFDDLLDDFFRLAGFQRLLAIDLLFLVESAAGTSSRRT